MPVRQSKKPMLPVKNARLVDAANRTTSALLETNRSNIRNAIEASGFPVTIYNRLMQGRRCTCGHHNADLLDEKGNLSTGMIDSLVTGSASGIEEYGDPKYKHYTGNTLVIDSHAPNNEVVEGTTINLVGGQGDPLEDDFGDLADALNLDATDVEPNRLFLGGNRACGLCFGTTYVGGFEPLYGSRYICDATHDHVMYRAALDVRAAPNAFDVFDGGHITFEVVFPAGQEFAMVPAVFENKRRVPLTEYQLLLSDNGVDWVEATAQAALAACNGLTSWVRICPSSESGLRFSHIEFLSSQRDGEQPPRADFPDVTKQINNVRADAYSESSIILPGDVVLNRWSVVIDHLPGLSRHWMVSSIRPRRDQHGNVYDTTLESRAMDLNELGMLLRPLSTYLEPLV